MPFSRNRGVLRKYLTLFWLNFLVGIRNVVEFFRVCVLYYPHFSFLKSDIRLLSSYFFQNPYRLSRQFLQERGDREVYAYGETPLTTLDTIAEKCRIRKEDRVFELGCGRGRTCFWLHSFLGCEVVGIDYVPEFIEIASRVAERGRLKGIAFRCEDFLESDLSDATVIYFYGTCSDQPFVEKLVEKLGKLTPGTKVITVSYPLEQVAEGAQFEVMKRFPARFTWGYADVYLQVLKSKPRHQRLAF